ncbi:unnamed protein product [Closterium sp. Naga37s-1]|nr:unnamed protein product [Closterium sp. Naga37s-1]
MPQWGPYLSAWLASLSSTSLRPGLFLFALGGGYLGLNSLNDPSVNPATTSASSRAVSAPVSLLKLFSNGELDRPVDDGFSASDGFPSGVMGLGGAAVSLHGVVNFNFVVAMAALLSASGLCCAALLTHGLGGRMRYRHLAWMFWQPFVGGLRFVLMQAMAWTLFSFSLLIFSSVAVVAAFVGHTTLGYGLLASAGATGLASEFLLMASLLTFECPSRHASPAAASPRATATGGTAAASAVATAAAAVITDADATAAAVNERNSRSAVSSSSKASNLPPLLLSPSPPPLPARAAAAAAAVAAETEAEAGAESAGVALSVTERACRGGGSVQGSVGGEAWRAVAVRPAQWTERELFVATRSAREVAGAAVRGVVQCVMRGMMRGLEGGVVRKTNEAAMEIVEDVSEAVTGCAVGRVEGGDRREGLLLLGACDSATSSTCDEFSLSVCEVLWWVGVKARSTTIVAGLYCWQYCVAAALLAPILLLTLLPAHPCTTNSSSNTQQQQQPQDHSSCSYNHSYSYSDSYSNGYSYGFGGMSSSAVVCGLRMASAALLTAMAWAFAYCVICPGGYERSGRGERKWVQRIVMPLLEEAAAAYFHGISIVKEGAWRAAHGTWENRRKHQEHDKQEEEEGCKEKGHRLESGEGCVEGKGSDVTAASPPRPLIFTYHPHGLMPAVMAWFPLSSSFRALFPATRPVPLVASVCFRIPLARTYCLWGGVREVSRQGFLTALKDTGAAVLCPGGQSELTYHATNQSSCIALCARKIGFVRIAVQSNALLVPTLSFGEPHSFDNLFHWPSLQRFTYRRFGFPIPFWPVGLFGCLPLPRDRPMALVMGRPFDPRSLIPTINSEDPSYEDLCTIRDYYYAEVKALFDRHKAIHGFPHLTLELRK